jgi:hypothetical protein
VVEPEPLPLDSDMVGHERFLLRAIEPPVQPRGGLVIVTGGDAGGASGKAPDNAMPRKCMHVI